MSDVKNLYWLQFKHAYDMWDCFGDNTYIGRFWLQANGIYVLKVFGGIAYHGVEYCEIIQRVRLESTDQAKQELLKLYVKQIKEA